MTVDQIIAFMLAGAKCGRFGELAEAAEEVLHAANVGVDSSSLVLAARLREAIIRWNEALQSALQEANEE